MKYVVGIDLGTTNSVVAFVPIEEDDAPITVLALPQLTAPGAIEERPLLPSFLYLPADKEFSAAALRLPWGAAADAVVGAFAQQRAGEVPDRVIGSAKSWLSYAGGDRTAAILPWGSADDIPKLSPVDVSARYLAHIRSAWDAQFPPAPLAKQDVLITVPASFDPGARELTVQAAAAAGLPHVTLLEEPQAALYSWIRRQRGALARQAGGRATSSWCATSAAAPATSRSSRCASANGDLALERIAVGDHILLGGDNMDLALAYHAARRASRSRARRSTPGSCAR